MTCKEYRRWLRNGDPVSATEMEHHTNCRFCNWLGNKFNVKMARVHYHRMNKLRVNITGIVNS